MDNQSTIIRGEKKIHVEYLSAVFLVLALVLGLWLWRGYQKSGHAVNDAVKKQTASSTVPSGTSIPVSNFQHYRNNNLPRQFPLDFPNPAINDPGVKIVLNESMNMGESTPGLVSIFRFETVQSSTDILKSYQDYFTKNGWQAKLSTINAYRFLKGTKGRDTISVSTTQSADSITTAVTLIASSLPQNIQSGH